MTLENEDIAIVGMAGLYPGADDVEVFWSNILSKRDCVTEAPTGWDGDGSVFAPDSSDPLKIYTRRGGFLGDLSRFDAKQFGTMPLSVAGGQPDQYLALKLAHDALADAGCKPGKFDGSRTGVILGHAVHAHRGNTNGIQQAWFTDQVRALLSSLFPDITGERLTEAIRALDAGLPKLTPESIPGLVPNVLTGRIANRLDLMGPNYIIDAACSSSIIAVDLAITELRMGRANMMLAGGINTTTSPLVYGVFCSVDALSRQGLIRPFDRRAGGTVLGEGGGILVLKLLKDALKADDRIYAVIKGVGQSSDGKSSGLMAPRLEGEVLAVRRAYEQTGIDPATIGLIEAHGTGIPLGDRTEIEALRTVFGERQGKLPHIPLGSVKSMIGHCIPAAGSASIIKMAMALTDKILPPTLCDEINPDLGIEGTPFTIASEVRPWVHAGPHPRRAAANAFGFGGINAHMILEESPQQRSSDPTAAFMTPLPRPGEVEPPEREEVVAFSAVNREGLLAELDAFNARSAGRSLAVRAREAWDIAAAQGSGPLRLAVVAESLSDLDKKIGSFRAKYAKLPDGQSLQTRNGIYFEPKPIDGKVAFLFPGEMGQYPDMMKDVTLAFPEVREWFDVISATTRGRREVPLHEVIYPPTSAVTDEGRVLLDDLLHRVDYGSEMVFAADQAVAGLLRRMGIKADAMLGHSTGENAALVASGRLDVDRDRVGAMIAEMNTIFAGVDASGVVPKGALLNVAAMDRGALEAMIAKHPGVSFTMDNCPNQAILFGQDDVISALEKAAVAGGAVCTRLPISWGYHTEHVAPMAKAFGHLFEGVAIRKSPVTLYSCSTAAPFPDTRTAFLKTAISQYTTRVRFTEAINRMYADGIRIFVECGPNATLTAFARDTLGARPHLAVSADNRRRGMVSQLRHLAAQLFTAGVSLDIRPLLTPDLSADQLRRIEARDKHRKSARLISELPTIDLRPETMAKVREILVGEATTAPVAPAASLATSGAAPARQAPPAMQPQPRAVQAPRNPSRVTQRRVEVLDLTARFDLPMPFRAFLLRGQPSLQAMVPWLSAAELSQAQVMVQRRGWTEWALSRLAVKQAIAALTGQAMPASLSIAKEEGGAPLLAGPSGEVLGPEFPAISLAHSMGIGLGVAAAPGWRIGIDYDVPARVRSPEEFRDTVLSGAEMADLRSLPPGAEGATLAWCLKEAVAKALGVGMRGRPQDFVLLAFDPVSGAARLSYQGAIVAAAATRVGEGVATMAWVPALATAVAAAE